MRKGSQLFRYGVSGVISCSLTIGLSEVFRLLAFRAETAFALTLSTMICINFVVCSVWVFRGNGGSVRRQFVVFVLTSLGFRSAEFGAFLVVHTWLNTPYMLSVVLILGVSAVAKFLLLRGIVFAKSRVPAVEQ